MEAYTITQSLQLQFCVFLKELVNLRTQPTLNLTTVPHAQLCTLQHEEQAQKGLGYVLSLVKAGGY